MPKNNLSSVVERYKQLISVLQELASILNTEQLLERIVDAAGNLCDAELAWILFPNNIKYTLVLDTGNFTKDTHYQGLSLPLNNSLEGWVYSNQKAPMINELSICDQRFRDFIQLPETQIKSLLA